MYVILSRSLLIDDRSINLPREEVVQCVREFLYNAVLQRHPGQTPESQPAPSKLQEIMIQSESTNSDLVKYLLIAHYFHVRNLLKKVDPKGTAATV